jgi:branched-subunit amino acid ABC-type transport system permease component
MYEFIQHLINGLAAGTIYALVALGYTMVYGVLKLINFAHGDVMMVGVYVAQSICTVDFVKLRTKTPLFGAVSAQMPRASP